MYFLTVAQNKANVLEFAGGRKDSPKQIVFPDAGDNFSIFVDQSGDLHMLYGCKDGSQKYFFCVQRYFADNWEPTGEMSFKGYCSLSGIFPRKSAGNILVLAWDYYGAFASDSTRSGEQVKINTLKPGGFSDIAYYPYHDSEWDESLGNIYLGDMQLDNHGNTYLIFGNYGQKSRVTLSCFKNKKWNNLPLPAELAECEQPSMLFDKQKDLYVFAHDSSGKMRVFKNTRDHWQPVPLPAELASQEVKFDISAAAGSDRSIYVAFADWVQSYHNKAVILQLKNTGWTLIGQKEYDYNITEIELAVNSQNTPFVALSMWK